MGRRIVGFCIILLLILGIWTDAIAIRNRLQRERIRRRWERARRVLIPFPLHGSFLVCAMDEVAWYRVDVPTNRWTKIADGSFTTADWLNSRNGERCSLWKADGKQAHFIDVQTGKETFTPLAAHPDDGHNGPFDLEGYRFTWSAHRWHVSHAGRTWTIPDRGEGLVGPEIPSPQNMTPWAFFSPREVLFLKQSFPVNNSMVYDYLLVDTVSGAVRTVMHLPKEWPEFIWDSANRRMVTLGQNGKVERWVWANHRLVRDESRQLPPTGPDEYYSDLTVIDGEWLIYKTLTSTMMYGIGTGMPTPNYYVYNLRSGAWAVALKPPAERPSDVIEWIPDGPLSRPFHY